MTRIKDLIRGLFRQVPSKYQEAFQLDCTEKNLRRFSILPYFNIVTQVACIFIYLYVYPSIFPERPAIDRGAYLWFSAVYFAINIASAIVLGRLRLAKRTPRMLKQARVAVALFLLAYVVLEASQVAVELEISGNIYRFLATFFVVSFFPVIPRFQRLGYMALYTVISEAALAYLQWQGIPVHSYPEINAVFFVVCLVATNFQYNAVIRNFSLHMDLLEKNKQMEKLNEQLHYLSDMDPLTGLHNRRSFNEYFDQTWKTALRVHREIGIMMLDIDNFKSFNDTYGHQEGDACLAAVANCIQAQFSRATDMCARYGGEEFVVLLPYTMAADVRQLADQVRDQVAALALPHSGNPPYGIVTVSIGVATQSPAVGEEGEELLRRADIAMYAAKAQGRNRVAIASEPDVPAPDPS